MTTQDCSRCPQRAKCWFAGKPRPGNAVFALNLLVCRLKLGVRRDATTRLLLRLLRPKVLKLAQWMQRSGVPTELEELIMDIESTIIEILLVDYEMGERAWPLHYLFARPRGVVYGWARKRIAAARRDAQLHVRCDPGPDLEERVAALNTYVTEHRVTSAPPAMPTTPDYAALLDAPQATAHHQAALTRVHDGYTLTLAEYRVMRFCLANAQPDAANPAQGLHSWLARHARSERRTVSKHYRRAAYKLMAAAGVADRALRAKGIDVHRVNAARRTRWLHGLTAPTDRLSPEEMYDLLHTPAGATLADVCWAFGVSDRAYHTIRARYADCTLAQIRAAERARLDARTSTRYAVPT